MDARGYRLQAIGSMVDAVHRGHVRQQRLGGADVRRRLLATDMLLARGQRHAVGLPSVNVHGDADDAARRLPHVRVPRREKRGVGTAVAKRNTEPLRVAEDDVRAHLSGRCQQRQCEQVRAYRDEDARAMRVGNKRLEIGDRSELVRVLKQHAEHTRLECHRLHRADMEFDVERFCTRAQHVDRLRQTPIADEKEASFSPGTSRGSSCARTCAVQKGHGFSGRCRLVEQRRVGDFHPGQFGDHRLKIQQRLETPLRNLRLIRRVGRVPAGILHDHAEDHGWRDRVVVAEPDVRAERLVSPRDGRQAPQICVLAFSRREIQGALQAYRSRNGVVYQRVERYGADGRKHSVAIVWRGTYVSTGKLVGRVESVHPRCD
jgi:hypothetical protein